jgi:hypothetical protein
MSNAKLVSELRNKLFGDRDNLQEAFDFFQAIVNGLPKKEQAPVYIGLQVVLNTICNELEVEAE